MKNQAAGPDNNDEVFLAEGACDPHLYMSAIRGSGSYWKKYTGDIIAMIKQLGIPTFFLTFSFDDMNSLDCLNALWKAEHGPQAEILDPNLVPFEVKKELLNKYPVVAARHFCMRLNKFLALLKTRSQDIFGAPLLDFTVRVEFQARGSPHAHCLLWLDFPHAWDSPEGKAFIDRNVSCSLKTKDKDLVLKYQNHRHTATCFKNKKATCRFQFPRKPSSDTVILDEGDIRNNGGRFVELKRDISETMINNYHPVLLQMLKCNIDIQPVTGAMAVAYYIAKYIAKSEPAQIREEIHDSIQAIKNSNIPARQKINRIAMKLMRNREISAQEAAFRLCHLFLRQSSRLAVFLPTFMKCRRIRMIRKESIGQTTPEFCLNIIDRYTHRPTSLNSLCLYEFASQYTPVTNSQEERLDEDLIEGVDVDEEPEIEQPIITLKNNKGKMKKRSRPAVIKHPNFDFTTDRDSYYYSLLLMYLPFREETFCDEKDPTEVFQERRNELRSNNDNHIIRIELATELDQALLRMTDFAENDCDPSNIDNEFSMSFEEPDEELSQAEAFPETNIVEDIRLIHAKLSPDQKAVFSLVENALKTNNSANPLRLITCGSGGTGKSFLIGLLSKLIRNYHSHDSLLIAAPTGIAAFNVNGLTLHRAFALAVEIDKPAKYNKLGGKKLQELRHLYKNLKFIILDEFSMINYETLRSINKRLCDIFQTDEPFGGRNILIFGDVMQLKPPRGSWIFSIPQAFKSEVHLWRLCKFVELHTNHRQSNADQLLGICNRLRVGELNQADIEVLNTRMLDKLNSADFEDCIRVFPKLAEIAKHNYDKALQLKRKLFAEGKSSFNLIARDTYADGLRFGQEMPSHLVPKKEGKYGGFPKCIEIGEGSKIMLRRNISVEKGLVSGAVGTIVSIKWPALRRTQSYSGELPEEVRVRFDHSGKIHPIGVKTVEFYGSRNTRISRAAIPIVLAWAINTHKMQGLTVNKIVIDLGHTNFASGMLYVALSRVRTLNGLAISAIDTSKLISTETYRPFNKEAFAELERLRSTVNVD